MPTYYIYKLSDPRTHEVKYVGCSISPKTRLKAHLKDKSNTKKSAWIKELVSEGLTPYMSIESTKQNKEEAILEEIAVYNKYKTNSLVCEDPNTYHYKQSSGKLKKAKENLKESDSKVKQVLINNKLLKLDAIAKEMYPNNKNAKSYLYAKLTGMRNFTESDELKAIRVLKALASRIENLTIADHYD